MNDSLNKDQIRNLLPHREPMLLIDQLTEIKKLFGLPWQSVCLVITN